jgi:4-amino-4-deoxy-L-arabinose transferase-like glycosyltransferase
MRLKPIVAACLLAGLYYFAVQAVVLRGLPPDATGLEETAFSLQANTVREGNTPLFFHAAGKDIQGELWFQPIGVYATALVPRAVSHPGAHAGAIAAAANVVLVYLIAHAIAGTAWAAVAAALVLIFTPGHLIFVNGTDSIYPATLVLLWLFGLLAFLKRDSARALYGAALALGLCVYSHPTGPLTAVFLWGFTLAITWRRNRVRLVLATIAFAVTWIPAAAWFILHPNTYADTFGRWFIFAAHIVNPLDGVRAFLNPNTLGMRASHYWGFWDPSWLFFNTGSTRPPLLWLAAPFLILALARARRRFREAMTVVIGAALIVPLAGASFGVPYYIDGAAAVLPLLAVLTGVGVDQLVGLLTRRPLEDDVAVAAAEGWNSDHLMPRS